MLSIYCSQKDHEYVSPLTYTIAGSKFIRCRFVCHSYARARSQIICFCLVFLLSLSSVVGRVSARLNSSDFGRVSTRSAISWDKTPLFEYAFDCLHCQDMIYVYSVNTVGVLSIGYILLIIYWHFLLFTDHRQYQEVLLQHDNDLYVCELQHIRYNYFARRPNHYSCRHSKGNNYDNFVVDWVIAAIPIAKATNAFAEMAVAPRDLTTVLIVGVVENALFSSCVAPSSVICFCEGGNRRKQSPKLENRKKQ